MAIEKRKVFIINTSYFLILFGITYIALKYLFGLIAPFIIGFLVAFVLQRGIQFLSAKLRLPKKLAAVFSVLLFYLVIGFLLFWFGMTLYAGIKDLVEKMPGIYSREVEPVIGQIFEYIERIMTRFDLSLVQLLEDFHDSVSQSIGKIVSDVSSMAIATVTSTVSWVPKVFLGVVLSIISSVFFAMDYEMITEFFTNLLPDKRRGLVGELQTFITGIGGKYIKAYSLLMLITFTEVAIGLSILRVDGAFSIAAFTAVVDILPVLGTGLVLIPWALFHLIKGNLSLGLGLVLIYVVITVIRNVLEPKLVGQQIGLHPIVMLLCMYAGVRIFGVIGLFILPFSILVIKYLYDHGKLHPEA
ncbi:MAG: sporulation integral membrane protein YtvI [Firmicutes bacterium]|nr:sporulation integral membrane protein YtvI [Bacillota bacterium]